MDFKLLVDRTLLTIGRRASRATRNKLVELGGRGVSNSSSAVTDTFSVLTKELTSELSTFLESLSRANSSTKTIVELRKSIIDFVDREYDKHRDYLKEINVFEIGQMNWDDFIQKQKDETLSAVELKILALRIMANDKRKKFWWEFTRLLLPSILGGVIGAYLKGFFGNG